MTTDTKLEESRRQIEQSDELHLYFAIQETGGFIWHMEHDMGNGRIPEKDWPLIDAEIAKIRPLQIYAVSQLTRVKEKEDYSKFRPEGNWKSNIPDEK